MPQIKATKKKAEREAPPPKPRPLQLKDFPRGLHSRMRVHSFQRGQTLREYVIEILEREVPA